MIQLWWSWIHRSHSHTYCWTLKKTVVWGPVTCVDCQFVSSWTNLHFVLLNPTVDWWSINKAQRSSFWVYNYFIFKIQASTLWSGRPLISQLQCPVMDVSSAINPGWMQVSYPLWRRVFHRARRRHHWHRSMPVFDRSAGCTSDLQKVQLNPVFVNKY